MYVTETVWRFELKFVCVGELHGVFCSRVKTARRMRWAAKVTRMGETINEDRVQDVISTDCTSNKSPTRCNNFPVYYPNVYLQLNMFRASSLPSSGAQWLQ
jgi:hypothetical protein